MPKSLLKIQKLSFSFGDNTILKDLSFELNEGEIATLIGWSGSGKTTLFKILTGLLPADDGAFSFNGHLKDSISYMTQDDLLLPWRTVLQNLLLLTELGKEKLDPELLKAEAISLLTDLGIEHTLDYYPDQLSGGMKKRVSLARCLLQKKPLLFLDEPFGALDVVIREQIYDLLKTLRTKMNCTILMVTHDFRDAIYLSDRIFFMHEGSIKKSWHVSPEDRSNPLAFYSLSNEIRKSLFEPV